MNRATWKQWLKILAMVVVGGWLLMDATTNVLYARDPVSGRAKGCYTQIEILLGYKSPTNWVRPAEFICVGILGVAVIVAIVKLPGTR